MSELINLDRILYPDPVAAGMDIYTIASLTKFFRCANEHTVPIVVKAEGDYWRLGRRQTSRHRIDDGWTQTGTRRGPKVR